MAAAATNLKNLPIGSPMEGITAAGSLDHSVTEDGPPVTALRESAVTGW